MPEALPEMSEEEQRFVQELHARTEESKSVHFVGDSVLGSNSSAGREARRSDDINVWDYCVVRGDAAQGSPPWWIGKVLAVTVENSKVTALKVQECGDEAYRGNEVSVTATHARIFKKVIEPAQLTAAGEVLVSEVAREQFVRTAHGAESGFKPVTADLEPGNLFDWGPQKKILTAQLKVQAGILRNLHCSQTIDWTHPNPPS